jgi:MarR family transcriptional regulator for hemolysin
MLEYDFEASVGCWVASTAHSLRRALGAELAKEKITLRQWEVLAWIAFENEPAQVQLADRMGIEAHTLAGVLARMERDGWLERFCCPDDRRKKRLRATPKAEELWNHLTDCCNRVRERATAGISADELTTLKSVCERMRANLEADSVSAESSARTAEKVAS